MLIQYTDNPNYLKLQKILDERLTWKTEKRALHGKKTNSFQKERIS